MASEKTGTAQCAGGNIVAGAGNHIENPCERNGCIIEAENQVLGERIPVVGVPFQLNYRSNRTLGRAANYNLNIPLQEISKRNEESRDNNNWCGSQKELKRIELEVSIGGQKIRKVFSDNLDNAAGPLNTPNYTYEWDGKDVYGRSLYGKGRHQATVRIGYVYEGEYEVPAEVIQSFGELQKGEWQQSFCSGIAARQEVIGWTDPYTINIGSWFPSNAGLGYWTLDIHHAYDPNDEVLYRGDGGQRRVSPLKQNGKLYIASEDGGVIYEFSNKGRHLRTLDSLMGNTIYTFSYLNGYLVEMTDIDGDTTTIERDTNNNPVAIIAPYGQHTELALDTNGYLASVKNPAGETHQMVYTADGLLIQFTNPRSQVANYQYDIKGFFQEDTDPAGGGWKLARTENPEVNGYVVTMTSKEDRKSIFNVAQLEDGTVQRVNTAADGTQTRVTQKTEDDNKLTTTERADGTKITLQEGPDWRFGMQSPLPARLTVTTPKGLVATITTARKPFNEDNPDILDGFIEQITVNGHTSESVYDVSNKTITVTSATNRQSISYLDDKGRVVREHIPALADVHYSYDNRGRLIETRVGEGTDARTTKISYDENGYISLINDALNREISFVYDAVGRVTTQILSDGREIYYSYDANDNVTAITPPNRPAHRFDYTEVDLQTQYTPPVLTEVPEPQTRYEYNLDKQLTKIVRPDGLEMEWVYDFLHPSMGDKSPTESPTGRLNLLRLPNEEEQKYFYDNQGNLRLIFAPNGSTLTYTYDGSLPLSETWGRSHVMGKVANTYDNDFRITSTSVNDRHTVNYQYDADDLLTDAGFLKLAYHPQNGLLTTTQLGELTTDRTHNLFGEIATETANYGEDTLYNVQYRYDKLGRITQKIETIEGDEVTYNYGYDETGRLVEVETDGIITEQYSYDSNGNRLSADTATGFVEGSYDEQDRFTQYGDTIYEYTTNGELRSKNTGDVVIKYEYDVFGNLRTVELPDKKIEYLIDARNRRIGKQIDGEFRQGFLYQGSLNPIAELDTTGNVVTRFVYGSKANVPDYMIKEDRIYRILSNHLGSPRLVVDIHDGTVVQRMDYDVFGNVIQDTNPGFQPFGFAGGLYDADTGLVRFGARDYDPETGRWTAKDPILFDGGDSNLYEYVVNDPINFFDLNGRWIINAIAGAITGTVNAYYEYKSGGNNINIALAFAEGFVSGSVSSFVGGKLLLGASTNVMRLLAGANAGAAGYLTGLAVGNLGRLLIGCDTKPIDKSDAHISMIVGGINPGSRLIKSDGGPTVKSSVTENIINSITTSQVSSGVNNLSP